MRPVVHMTLKHKGICCLLRNCFTKGNQGSRSQPKKETERKGESMSSPDAQAINEDKLLL